MAEDKRIKKELATKAAKDAYIRRMEALQGFESDLEVSNLDLLSSVVTTESPLVPVVSFLTEKKLTATSAVELIATSLATTSLVTELTYELTPQSATEGSFLAEKISIPTISLAAGTPSVMMATVATFTPATSTIEYPEITLARMQDRVYKERGLMFKEPIIPVDPEDSKRLARLDVLANREQKMSSKTSSTMSPELAELQKEIEERKQAWIEDKKMKEMQKKKEEMAISVYQLAKDATPTEISVPMMPGYTEMMANPMATDSTLLVPLNTDSRTTRGNSTILVLDMQTEKGVAMLMGLVGSGKFSIILVLHPCLHVFLLIISYESLLFSFS